MLQKPIEQIADVIRLNAAKWRDTADLREKAWIESQMGAEIFKEIFAEDTDVLGPWHLKAKGKRKEAKYEKMDKRWGSFCRIEDLGIDLALLTTWYRCVATKKLLAEKGFDTQAVEWEHLARIQRLKSINQIVEQAKKTVGMASIAPSPPEQGRQKHGTTTGETPKIREIPPRQELAVDESAGPKEPPEVPLLPQARSHAQEPVPSSVHPNPSHSGSSQDHLTVIEQLIESPSDLVETKVYSDFMSDPDNFKKMKPAKRSELLVKVDNMARKLEKWAREYRDFEAVLRWSKRLH